MGSESLLASRAQELGELGAEVIWKEHPGYIALSTTVVDVGGPFVTEEFPGLHGPRSSLIFTKKILSGEVLSMFCLKNHYRAYY